MNTAKPSSIGIFRHLIASLVMGLVTFAVSPAPTFAAQEQTAETWRALREEALAYEHGEGVPKNSEKAVALYCQGAKAGDPEARYSLGWMYMNGRGVPRSDGLAAYFFKLAADQGHVPSLKMLPFVGQPVTEPPDCLREKTFASNEVDWIFTNEKQRRLATLINRLAPEYGVSPRFAYAVAHTESNLDPNAISPKNAQGIMQLIPDTSARFNVKKPFDPEQNVRGGLAYLRWLLAYFRGDVALVAAAYNAGEGAVNHHRGIPPYAETRQYVKRILALFPQREHPFDPAITQPSPNLPQIARHMAHTEP
ncbi:transglycosylase SLT domain-containing protein [Rugosibacter aromaticivorans]|nr:transglycosylase SLT domain-containing protein [Rugosibacter aromaticivorans]